MVQDNVATSINQAPNEGAALLDDIVAAFRRHLALPPHAAEAMALWMLFAHSFEAWGYSPRLVFTSPGAGCGKTTALEMLKLLCPGGKLIVNASEAYVFHTTDERKGQPLTILLDECDTFFQDKPTLTGVLNSGFQPGSVVGRCEKDAQGNFRTREYAIEAPIAAAGIGDDWLWDALRSRSIVVRMKKPRADEPYEKFRAHRHGPELQKLAHRAAQWAQQNIAALRRATPQTPDALRGRAADVWEPLIAIAGHVGGRWPKLARRIALAMSGHSEPLSGGTTLLAAIRSIFRDRCTDRLSSEELCAALGELGDDPWAASLDPSQAAALLKPYEIEPKRIKFNGNQLRGYTREQFEDAWARSLPPEGDGVTPPRGGSDGVEVTMVTGA